MADRSVQSSQDPSPPGTSVRCEGSLISTLALDQPVRNASTELDGGSLNKENRPVVPNLSAFELQIKKLSLVPPTEVTTSKRGTKDGQTAAAGTPGRMPSFRSRSYSLDRYLNTPEKHEQLAVSLMMALKQEASANAAEEAEMETIQTKKTGSITSRM